MAVRKKKKPSAFTLTMDPDVLKALDHYVSDLRELRNPFVQRLIRDHLMEKGYWPPKSKEAK